MDNSPFRKLPAELLNRIAELALHFEGGITVHPFKTPGHMSLSDEVPGHLHFTEVDGPAGLAKTCKEFRAAYLPMYYASNTFTVFADEYDVTNHMLKFFEDVGSELVSKIPDLTIDIYFIWDKIMPTLKTTLNELKSDAVISHTLDNCKTVRLAIGDDRSSEERANLTWHDLEVSVASESQRITAAIGIAHAKYLRTRFTTDLMRLIRLSWVLDCVAGHIHLDDDMTF